MAQDRARARSAECKALSAKGLWLAQAPAKAAWLSQPAWQIAPAVPRPATRREPNKRPSGRKAILRFSPHFPFDVAKKWGLAPSGDAKMP